jgi:hypothetical protein
MARGFVDMVLAGTFQVGTNKVANRVCSFCATAMSVTYDQTFAWGLVDSQYSSLFTRVLGSSPLI